MPALVQVFTEAHCGGHLLWNLHDPEHRWHAGAPPTGIGDALKDVYVAIDREIGLLLDAVGEDATVILLANHGVVTFGPDLLTAFFRMETTEHIARVTLVTELLGRQVLLTNRDVERLLASRNRYRDFSTEPGHARTAESAAADDTVRNRRDLEVLLAEALRNLNDHH